MQSLLTVLAVSCLLAFCVTYQPSWESLDERPLPEWYDQAKIGIFLHWGVYSVPAMGEWFWKHWEEGYFAEKKFMMDNYRPGFTYQDFAPEFTAKFFQPQDWAELFKESGAKYVVLTSKHHDGYTLWPSPLSYSWNSQDVGPHEDLLGDLTKAVRKSGLRMGYYYSLMEWFHPLYLADRENDFETTVFSESKAIPELMQLVLTHKPDIVWADGEWEANDTYWGSPEFLKWLYDESPVKDEVITNDRWGIGCKCKCGDVYTCRDRYNPGVLQTHKWENAMSLDRRAWGFRSNASSSDYLTSDELIEELVSTVSCGGNILINVGPTMDGVIAPIFQERLLDLGQWLKVNGEAIYESSPWIVQNDTLSNTWYTELNGTVYAIALEWPQNEEYQLGSAGQLFETLDSPEVELLGYGNVRWIFAGGVLKIQLPDKAKISTNWAWTFKIYETEYNNTNKNII